MSKIGNSNSNAGISVKVSAPGKVILHGEHSVVYHKLAVAAGLGLRTYVTITETPAVEDTLQLHLKDLNVSFDFPLKRLIEKLQAIPLLEEFNLDDPKCIDNTELLRLAREFLQERLAGDGKHTLAVITFIYLFSAILLPTKLDFRSLSITVKSDLKLNAGMGSSASFSVSIVAALFEYIKCKQRSYKLPECYKVLTENSSTIFTRTELNMISRWALQGETVFHGRCSGIDNTICTYGSLLEFIKDQKADTVPMKHELKALLVDTKVSKDTLALTQRVADVKSNYSDIVRGNMENMNRVACAALERLKCLNNLTENNVQNVDEYKQQYEALGVLADMNQGMLQVLRVSHPEIDRVCAILTEAGLHGKITGAGGGGFVVALVPFYFPAETLEEVQKRLTGQNYGVMLLKLGDEGVKVH